ncbi:uncharacterized protein TNIN_484401 [Trichonephila inaurata madagascariensis]|uniref:Integrase p58-like C-terminal domain-containing protein n=1 Tax=Trichonephila inaurata madagascariensis TaxID=2747483 RepID=A0A8X7CKW4_9ARAC|nr:uncharacterized protein TNIN_484401 [Trichonephila inaurata madagascariensis]
MRPLSTILSVNCIGISSPPIGNHLRIASAMVADQSVNGTSALMKECIIPQPGELVLVFTPFRKDGLSEKLLRRYFGPYRVVKKLSEVTYEVEELGPSPQRRKPTQVVHVLRMKKYYTPEEQERILTNNTEKLPSNSRTGATYNVGTDKRDTTLDCPGEIVPYRGPMTRSRKRNVKEL